MTFSYFDKLSRIQIQERPISDFLLIYLTDKLRIPGI